jgi:two-component system sensor histidine kinase KdpD
MPNQKQPRDGRPDPDRLIAEAREEEARAARGRLRVFFGASAGVGKTYAMLEQARAKQAAGCDIVVGWAETHGRKETAALLEGLESLPPRVLQYRGVDQREFDLEGALARRPAILLLDELAHTNVPGSRHVKRWQDAEELLASGIDVYTTVNVQHIESVNDIVAQVTGVTVRETVPDRILEGAEEIEFIDLTPDDLLQRLREGKVYMPAQAERAMQSFFTKVNLIALRELALRTTAERVDAEMRRYRGMKGIGAVWPVSERLLVSISPSPTSARVVRAAQRMAASLHAPWTVVYVETPASVRMGEANRQRVDATLMLAERLGAETAILRGEKVSAEILAHAREHNVTRIVVGKPAGPRWRYRLLGSVVDDLVRDSADVDVYVIRGLPEDAGVVERPPIRPTSPLRSYLAAVAATAVATGIGRLMLPAFAPVNIAMVYLLMIVTVAAVLGRGPSIVASFLGVAAFDFFCIPPYLTFRVGDTEYLLTFLVLLSVALVISTLAVRLRQQVASSRLRETRMATVYAITREFSRAASIEEIAAIAEQRIGDVFQGEIWILLAGLDRRLEAAPGVTSSFQLADKERAVAQWACDHGQAAGPGTGTLESAGALYVPLTGSLGTLGVIGLFSPQGSRELDPERMHLLEVLASQTAAALERSKLARKSQEAQVGIEAEKMRNALLSSVSHDLRTPLATLKGAASTLLASGPALAPELKQELLQAMVSDSERLERVVTNLLRMTQFDAGALQVRKEWQPVEEVVGSALNHVERLLGGRQVVTDVPSGLSMVPLDAVLIEQVLVNLIENAVRYSPEGAPVEIRARVDSGRFIVIEVLDRGPGIPEEDRERIFEKFHRLHHAGPGTGLGLAICRGIVEAHGGGIDVRDREGGGARFRFTLPLAGLRPDPIVDDGDPSP